MAAAQQPFDLSTKKACEVRRNSKSSSCDGLIFTWGGGHRGELGHQEIDKESECPLPCIVPGLKGMIQVACGDGFTAAVSVDGRLYCWGSGRGGKLGTGDTGNRATPTLIKVGNDLAVACVALGEAHGCCCTTNGLLFSWGVASHGCLGRSDGDFTVPGQVTGVNDAVFVSCGNESSAVVATQQRRLFTWGSGKFGKLGHGNESDVMRPMEVAALPSNPIGKVCLGSTYSGCVNENGEAFFWGYGVAGNLGQGTRRSSSLPLRVDPQHFDSKVVDISCTVGQIVPVTSGTPNGKENPHTIVVTESGCVYTFGSCHKGMLGNMREKTLAPEDGDELVPYRIGDVFRDHPEAGPSKYLHNVKIVQGASSSIHSAVLSEDGNVYTFGCGSTGRMGVRRYLQGLSGGRSRMKCYISAPTVIETFAENSIKVLQIATSRHHMAAVVNIQK